MRMQLTRHVWRVGWCFVLVLLQDVHPHFANYFRGSDDFGYGGYGGGYSNYGNGYGNTYGDYSGYGGFSGDTDGRYNSDRYGGYHSYGGSNGDTYGGYNRERYGGYTGYGGYNSDKYGGYNGYGGFQGDTYGGYNRERYGGYNGYRGFNDGNYGGYNSDNYGGYHDDGGYNNYRRYNSYGSNYLNLGLGGFGDYGFGKGFGYNSGYNGNGGLGSLFGLNSGGYEDLFSGYFRDQASRYNHGQHHNQPPNYPFHQHQHQHSPWLNMMPNYRQIFKDPIYMEHDNYLPHYHDKYTNNQYRNQYNYYIVNGKQEDIDKILPRSPPTWPPEGEKQPTPPASGKVTPEPTPPPGPTPPPSRTATPPPEATPVAGNTTRSAPPPTPPTPPPLQTTASIPSDSSSSGPVGDCAVQSDGTMCAKNRTSVGRERPRQVRVTFNITGDPREVDEDSLLCQAERSLCEGLGDQFNGILDLSFQDPSKPVMTISLMVPIIQLTPTDDILSAIDDSHNYGEYELFDSSVVTSRPSRPVRTTSGPRKPPTPASTVVAAPVVDNGAQTSENSEGLLTTEFLIGIGIGAGTIAVIAAFVVGFVVRKLSRRRSKDLMRAPGSRPSSDLTITSLDDSTLISSLGRSNVFPERYRGERMMWRSGDTMPDNSVVPAHLPSTTTLHTVEELHANVIGSV